MKKSRFPEKTSLVQFMHPGSEAGKANLTVGDIISWNYLGKHKRKFLSCFGDYIADLSNPDIKTGELCFWGEWEPSSEIIATYKENIPRYLSRPTWNDFPKTIKEINNTDPVVFGKYFFYTNCQQNTKRYATGLSKLHDGTLILFGSHINNDFYLDTVFVTRKIANLYFKSAPNERSILKNFMIEPIGNQALSPNDYPTLFHANIEPMRYSASCSKKNVFNSCRKNNFSTSLYRGVHISEVTQENQLFSFVPASLDSKNPFNRVKLNHLLPYVNGKMKQRYSIKKNIPKKDMNEFFQKIVEEVKKQGLVLGVRFRDID